MKRKNDREEKCENHGFIIYSSSRVKATETEYDWWQCLLNHSTLQIIKSD